MYCEICTFEDVLPIWNKKLWPNRVSKIKSRSALYCDARRWIRFCNVFITKKQKEILKYEPIELKDLLKYCSEVSWNKVNEKDVLGYGVCHVRQLSQLITNRGL